MRALVVAPQPFFSPRGTPFSVYYRTLLTAEMGITVDLLTYGQGEDVAIHGVRIIRIPKLVFGPIQIGPSWKKLLLDQFLVFWTVALLLCHRYDFVHAHEESAFFLRFLKPIFRFKLVYDMHSSLPEQLRNYRFTSSPLLIRLFERLEITCLGAADAVITICPELASYAVARMPAPDRHFLIENSIFDEVPLGRAPPPPTARRPTPPAGRPVVLYAGTFEVYQGIDMLIEAFAVARGRCPEAFLLLIGGTPGQVEAACAEAARHGLEGHCLILDRMSQTAVKAYMRHAAVLVSSRTHGTNTPLKIYEQLASERPLVATRILAHTQVLDDEVCFLVEPTAVALAEGLVRALTDGPARHRVVTNAKALYETTYARAAYESKVRAMLARLGLGVDTVAGSVAR